MARTFAYLRVSTTGQTTETQKQQIAAAGIAVEDYRIIPETVSGSIEAMKRPGFARLAAGRMVTNVLNVVAQFERELLIERTKAGIDRARAQGKRLGRPPVLDPVGRAEIVAGLKKGEAIAALARRFGTSRMTVQRIRDGHGKVNAIAEET